MEEETALNPMGNVIETIRTRIYEIRGRKVMLDRDLAELYHVETKQLKRQVKRNLTRFPKDFMFELSHQENDALRMVMELTFLKVKDNYFLSLEQRSLMLQS